ncbi:hypothetical protein [Caldimonas brevitalea]|uniref:DUF3617 family protein n=1 Tax=Caldimonas brevitalea TaxID=413882 RepID=A0A0G3BM46_9BURK|nr:hypothetical protein [Caldimonas brevitalea]AKJ29063.1 hypothetical protein AAW51_2372 [Caldimonas brevitalea]
MRHTHTPSLLLAAVVLLATASAPCSATEPLFDKIEIEGRSGRLHDNARGWLALPESEQLRAMVQAERCSAIGGPRGQFKVADGVLWLHALYRCRGAIELSSVYPDARSPWAATWVTGELTAELGKVECVSQAGKPVFERTARISVEAGKVTAVSYRVPSLEQCGRDLSSQEAPSK